MKNKKILFSGLAVSAAVASIIGLAQISQAAETESATSSFSRGRGQGRIMSQNENSQFVRSQITEEEKLAFEERRVGQEKRQEAIKAAISTNDYNAFKTAIDSDCKAFEKVTADNFAQFVKAHQLREEADKIFEDLGIEKGRGGLGQMKGFNR